MAFPNIPHWGSIVPGQIPDWDSFVYRDFSTISVAETAYDTATGQASEWLKTSTDTDGDGADRAQIHDDFDPGGWLELIHNDNASDVESIQLHGAQVRIVPGKDIYFACRFALSDVSGINSFVGLAVPGSANGHAGPTDTIGFRTDGDGNLDYVVEASSTETTADTTLNLADATGREQAVDVAFWFKYPLGGTPRITFYAFRGSGTVTAFKSDIITTNIPADDVDLALIITNDNADTGVDTLYCDSIFVAQKR